MITIPEDVLKDTERLSSLCHSVNEPIFLAKDECIDLVVMSIEVYDHLERAALSGALLYPIRTGIDAIENGDYHDARESVSEMKAKWTTPN